MPTWFWGPDGENLWFVEGEHEALLGIMATPEAQKLLLKGSILLQGYKYDLYKAGRDEVLGPWGETVKELAII